MVLNPFLFNVLSLLVKSLYNMKMIACKFFLLLFTHDHNEYFQLRSRDVKCTKAQLCSANTCTWNQALRFVDIDTLEQMFLTVTLKNLDQNENNDVIGQVKICPINVNSKADWYSLETIPSGLSLTRKVFH